ncbi:hypothetical protein BV22DRAFT_986942, partial [Leucogyrophana mollusca]
VPIVWETWRTEAEADLDASNKRLRKAQEKYEKDYKSWKARQEQPGASTRTKGRGKAKEKDDQPQPPKQPKLRMQKDEPVNLLRLATALKIFCGRSIRLSMLPRANELLREYLLEFKRLYGVGAMKPNFHWSVHLVEQVKDYGPVYNFWAFLSERLNKLLKSSNSNNRTGGGQVEISMMREFLRGAQIDSMV